MKQSPLNGKIVRPGRSMYNPYHADHYPVPKTTTSPPRKNHLKRVVVAVAVLVLVFIASSALLAWQQTYRPAKTASRTTVTAVKKPTTHASTTKTPAAVAAVSTQCASNTLSQLALVSISQRHMWACEGAKVVYDSPVVTGMAFLAADLTPTGTYHITGKETNLTLSGSDSTGSWNDPVSYWMPFLYNQYGAYGFHDATWRADSDFGNISPNSSDASHGCVELPLATAAWLYNWAPIGTTVMIES